MKIASGSTEDNFLYLETPSNEKTFTVAEKWFLNWMMDLGTKKAFVILCHDKKRERERAIKNK